MKKWSVADIPPQHGKLAIVTGANSGLGWHTAFQLARAGSDVILTARSEEKGRAAVERIREQLSQVKVRAEVLDLASLASVRAFAARLENEAKLDLLVNNAGVMAIPRRAVTEDGFERQLGTNFLGHFALTGLLMPVLLRARAPRVTTVSSIAANLRMKRIKFEDLQLEKAYDPWTAYCQSKLADLMFALELSRRCAAKDFALLSNAAHPGYAPTNLQTSGPGKPRGWAQRLFEKFASHEADLGALPTLRAATDVDAAPGSYYGPSGRFQLTGHPVPIAIPKAARNEAAAAKLWEIAESLTGVAAPKKTP
ncbi:MAG: oxidoreductase [Acidobacteriaceae bacterium]